MPKQTKEQFDNLLSQATAQMKDEIAKREVIPFRLDEQSVKKLQDIAVKKRQHVGALVREWVLERLAKENNEDAFERIIRLVESTNAQVGLLQKEMAEERKLQRKEIEHQDNLKRSLVHEIEHLRQQLRTLEKRIS
jgi:hypothetical protein